MTTPTNAPCDAPNEAAPAAASPVPHDNIRDGKCSFVVPRKNRLCTGTTSQQSGGDGKFCAIHRPDAARRVRCPVDPRHDVKESEVESHVVKCRAVQEKLRQTTTSPYFCLNASVPQSSAATTPAKSSTIKVRDLSNTEGSEFLRWVEAQHHQLLQTPWWSVATDRSQQLDAQDTCGLRELDEYVSIGDTKHRQQQSILCSLLLRKAVNGTLLTSVLEVGAGKGGVGCALKLARPGVAVTLVERASFSVHKEKELNKQLRHNNNNVTHDVGAPPTVVPIPPMERVSLDAKDFDAARWWQDELARRCSVHHGEAASPLSSVVCCGVVGKHLCGGCSDFALRMAEVIASTYCSAANSTTERKRPRLTLAQDHSVDGDHDASPPSLCTSEKLLKATTSLIQSQSCVVLATCCHHLCSYESYLGIDVMLEEENNGGLATSLLFPDAKHFDLTRSICSWAIIGNDEEHTSSKMDQQSDEVVVADSHWLKDTPRWRKVQLGRMAKTLIDAGRVRALQSTSLFDAVLYLPYVDPTMSGECYAIVALARGSVLDA